MVDLGTSWQREKVGSLEPLRVGVEKHLVNLGYRHSVVDGHTDRVIAHHQRREHIALIGHHWRRIVDDNQAVAECRHWNPRQNQGKTEKQERARSLTSERHFGPPIESRGKGSDLRASFTTSCNQYDRTQANEFPSDTPRVPSRNWGSHSLDATSRVHRILPSQCKRQQQLACTALPK